MDSKVNVLGDDGWEEYVKSANELIDSGDLDRLENDYKRKVAHYLEEARKELFADSDKWAGLVAEGLESKLTVHVHRNRISEWIAVAEMDASDTLKTIWTKDELAAEERVRAFCELLPDDRDLDGRGTRSNIASVLLMGLNVEQYPPFRIRISETLYELTGYDPPKEDADEAALYDHFLSFLDKFIKESRAHRVHLRHRLDAQGVVWQSQKGKKPFPLPRLHTSQSPTGDLHQNDWNEFDRRVTHFIESGTLKEWVEEKLDLGREMAEVREAVHNDAEDWVDQLENRALCDRDGHPIFWYLRNPLIDWARRFPLSSREALLKLWTKDARSVTRRLRDFCDLLPESVIQGPGTRTRVASALLMGLDAGSLPPYAPKTFRIAYSQTGFEHPSKDADEAGLYDHALSFIDQFLLEAQTRGFPLRHRHDMRTLIWWCLNEAKPLIELPNLEARISHSRPSDPQTLATELHLSPSFLKEAEILVKERRQVIFQGPPGTGKTYVAQALAKCLAGAEERVTLVQFHPSYAYEDFVRGFRPTITEGGHAAFELRDGPLLRAAGNARDDKDSNHFLIIDEINRGNLAKVFGELYFLLEYRDKKIRLQYQQEGETDFSLPPNLYIIGTMNTADRSIALVDLALRRRFYFIEFHPDNDPVKSVLRKWLGEGSRMEWVADVVEEANELLKDDRHAAIGPSYFMKSNLKEEDVPRIWKHSVLPYIEERLFGDDKRIEEFALSKLRAKTELKRRQRQQTGQSGDDANGDADRINNETGQPSGVPGQQADPSNNQ